MPGLKHAQGKQINLAYSNTVHLANSAYLLTITRIASANSLPPFHYSSLSPQSASCADHIHFSHVHPALTILHAKSDKDLLNPYIFTSKVCSHGGDTSYFLLEERCTWMVLQKQQETLLWSTLQPCAYTHIGLNGAHKIHHLSACKTGTSPPLLVEYW